MSTESVPDVRALFSYCETTGNLYWKVKPLHKTISVGDVAGSLRTDGYREVGIARRRYLAHRLVWLWFYGTWPDVGLVLDHINGNRLDNRIDNLRAVTRRQNQHNAKRHRAGRKVGAIPVKGRGKPWRSKIYVNGKVICLGSFDTEEEAHNAYASALCQVKESGVPLRVG
jgi:hypothetical protein